MSSRPSPILTSAQNRFLRGQAHGRKALLQVGGKGVTPALVAELQARPGVQSATAFGSRLHVAGKDAALLQQAVAPLAGCAGLRVAPAEASLEDVFISLIGQAQDNFGGGAQPS